MNASKLVGLTAISSVTNDNSFTYIHVLCSYLNGYSHHHHCHPALKKRGEHSYRMNLHVGL